MVFFVMKVKKKKIDSDLNLKIKKYGNTQLVFGGMNE